MANLTRASEELFRRAPDERFTSLAQLAEHCTTQQQNCHESWVAPTALQTRPIDSRQLVVAAGDDGAFHMNDWSFGQLCRLAGVGKDTMNRLTANTASLVLDETMPRGDKPLQLFTEHDRLRSLHGTAYTRLFNSHVLSVIQEYATHFEPPQEGIDGATGLYAGEQDLFCFLVDPTGWTEIGGQAFAPGFFVWNSEVGSRSIGIETFWFQAVCQNHIVWDAVEIVEFSRKHTRNVHDALAEIRRVIEMLVAKRDERRDGFVEVIKNAMAMQLGSDVEEVQKMLDQHGITRRLAKKALEAAKQQGALTLFSVVDALTTLCGEVEYASQRTALDQQASRLLELAAA